MHFSNPTVSVLAEIFFLVVNVPIIVIAELFAVDKHKRVANVAKDRNQKKYSQKCLTLFADPCSIYPVPHKILFFFFIAG